MNANKVICFHKVMICFQVLICFCSRDCIDVNKAICFYKVMICFHKVLICFHRRGYSVLQLDKISGGVYNIVPCNFRPGEEGPFFLDISSSEPVKIAQLR